MLDMYLKAKDLRKALENVPDDVDVMYQRIEDVYFEKHGWEPVPMLFENDDSDYIPAFSAYLHRDKNIFVINAHY